MAAVQPVGPDRSHNTHSPVRDDAATGVTEDLDREPDGVPHRVVGFIALFAVMLAMLVTVMFIASGTFGKVAAVLLAVIALPVLVGTLKNKAARERDHIHPSR